ncbi:Ctr copper transporter family-domain-containing protein [Cerioporus squamosus]|nr:Ctr copper transporter family-domain-containing protein [Cerioporus squamosus]
MFAEFRSCCCACAPQSRTSGSVVLNKLVPPGPYSRTSPYVPLLGFALVDCLSESFWWRNGIHGHAVVPSSGWILMCRLAGHKVRRDNYIRWGPCERSSPNLSLSFYPVSATTIPWTAWRYAAPPTIRDFIGDRGTLPRVRRPSLGEDKSHITDDGLNAATAVSSVRRPQPTRSVFARAWSPPANTDLVAHAHGTAGTTATLVSAHDHRHPLTLSQLTLVESMDMAAFNSSTMVMMVPWLHFTGGDSLIFKSWHPASNGAIAGACIGLVLFAMFERWVNAMRGLLDGYWRKRALALMSGPTLDAPCHDSSSPLKTPSVSDGVEEVTASPAPSQRPTLRARRSPRTVPPFIPSHDVPRGVLFAFQALLYYILMLAVMTFQAAFIISIIFGLMIGEVLFGRYSGGAKTHFSH